jgi:hypothetical protein
MTDWQRIDLGDARIDGLVMLQEGCVAWGGREGGPYAARVSRRDGAVAQLTGAGPITSAMCWERFELVVGTPPEHVEGDFPDGSWGNTSFDTVTDDVFDTPARLWVGCGDEDPMYVIADQHGELAGVDPGVGLAGPPSGLHLVGDPDAARLLVAGREVGVCVAGQLRDHAGGEGWQVWTCWGVEGATGGADWEQVPLEPAPEALSDLVEQHEPLIAGHRHLRPLAWRADGTPLEVPDVTLDPACPVVSVAGEGPEDQPPTLALQTEDGPQLWSRGDGGGWTSVDLPMGHLVVARRDLGDEDRLWVVVDGALWTGSTG